MQKRTGNHCALFVFFLFFYLDDCGYGAAVAPLSCRCRAAVVLLDAADFEDRRP